MQTTKIRTTNEFLQTFKKLWHKNKNKYNCNKSESCSIRFYPNSDYFSSPSMYCPLTFVANELGKGKYYTTSYREAAKALGMNEKNAVLIASAADFFGGTRRRKEVRKEMFKILGAKS